MNPFYVPIECQSQALFQSHRDVIVVSCEPCSDAAYFCLEAFLQHCDELADQWAAEQKTEMVVFGKVA